ncbi:hypothetical protein K456DRAFT_1722582 [Colletotrichum gloeosporioides 23]|nr:hypothetical protein K456DRAFT_1722582 [Colletotrichum gloeosporioides 23]
MIPATAPSKPSSISSTPPLLKRSNADLARLYSAVFRSNKQPNFIKAAKLQIYIWFPLHGPHSSKFQEAHFTVQLAFGSCLSTAGMGASPATTQSRTLILTTDCMFEDCSR